MRNTRTLPALLGLGLVAMSGIAPLLCGGAICLLGCKSCDGDSTPSGGAKREQQSERTQLRERMAARRLDRSKVYPKSEDGSVICGGDADCFVMQAENCTKSKALHTDSVMSYGLSYKVKARYTITGDQDGKCKLLRDTLMLDVSIDKQWLALLQKQGKTAEEIEQLRTDALETLREGNPDRFECLLTHDQVLEGSLMLAEHRFDPQFWRMACHEVEAPIGTR